MTFFLFMGGMTIFHVPGVHTRVLSEKMEGDAAEEYRSNFTLTFCDAQSADYPLGEEPYRDTECTH